MINLRIPGPTPLPPQVLKVLSTQMISHRGGDYEEIHKRVVANLKLFFQTKNDIFLLTSSGTGGLEAAVVNFFSPHDVIVCLTCGEFGNRWAEIARRFGGSVIQVKFPPGLAVDKDEVVKVLSQQKKLAGVFITHNETSTGVLNNLFQIAPIVKKHVGRPLLLVDSVSALGAVDLPMDKLGIDVVVTASQKAWMDTPGLAMMAVSPAALERHKTAKMPRYYLDLTNFVKFAAKNQTPATPAVTTLYGLDASLKLMKKEGVKKVFERHLQFRKYFREGVKKIGLTLLVDEKFASPTVTAIKIPQGIEDKNWRGLLKKKYKTILAGGMGELKGKIIRVAHMGYVSKKDLNQVLVALKSSLKEIS